VAGFARITGTLSPDWVAGFIQNIQTANGMEFTRRRIKCTERQAYFLLFNHHQTQKDHRD